ncbi:hypothetical protein C2S53_006106 [Perilla frutescens var. hirtella]|uniref:Amino acid transporter transmembrane domain-containing protein n=1 Tax=Perilla frutescens var. hirtella TaxID=608512 RepID=A0AAD4JIP9_PERFH|nr:hypothetical protein C2S53_006106 [Perilla frutescens var. hirtella]
MAEISNSGVHSFLGSSKVTPILDDPNSASTNGSVTGIAVRVERGSNSGGEKFPREFNPVEAWLPITESRNGSTLTATFHLVCSGIGIQILFIPIALVTLGWFWGMLCLSIAFSWQLYTIWLLVNLHESSPTTGVRYSRFLHLSIVAFGEKLGKVLAIFPTMYLSGGACVMYIITGGAVMKIFFKSMCGGDSKCMASTLTGAQCFLVLVCIAIFVAQFFPNLDSLAFVTLIGSITALAYCNLLWILPLTKGRIDDAFVEAKKPELPNHIYDIFLGFEILALAFRGHNLVLEIQGTLPTSQSQQLSCKLMWSAVMISYLLIALCMYPIAIVGYWAYGNKIPLAGGMLRAIMMFHNESSSVIGGICMLMIINYICAFQIFAMPTFDNMERIYATMKNKPCSRWVRSTIKLFFGALTYFIAVTFPFLPRLGAFIGAIGLPLTLVYPCLMWVAIKKPPHFGRMWCLNVGLASFGALLSIAFLVAALWSLLANGLKANFYKP